MKHFVRKCVLSMFTVLIMFTSFAQADTASPDNYYYDAATQSWTVVCGHGNPGQAVSFLAVYGTEEQFEINEENVMYLNQLVCDSNGRIEVVLVGGFPDTLVFLLGGAANSEYLHVIGDIDITGAFQTTVLPTALTTIENEAFQGSGMQYVILSSNVQAIGDRAFQECHNLTFIEIPSSVTFFGQNIFADSPNVIIKCVEGSPAHQYAVNENISYMFMEGN